MQRRLVVIAGLALLVSSLLHSVSVRGAQTTLRPMPVSFAAAAAYGTGREPEGETIADLNGDGRPDLVTANFADNTVSVLLGSGGGTFQPYHDYGTGPGPSSVAVGDLNGDGKPDIVIADSGSNIVSVLLGNGDGTFQAHKDYGTGEGPVSVAVADLNGDGRLDIVTANNANTVSALLGNGDGTFEAPVDYGTGGSPERVAVADLNGDGRPDIVMSNFGGSSVSVLLGNGDGTFRLQRDFVVGANPESVTVADFNGDGRSDIVTANSGGTVSVLLGAGDGSFPTRADYTVGSTPLSVAVADLNGDGRPDIVTANSGDNTVSVLPGNGDGTFQPHHDYGVGRVPSSVAIADLNGDGKPDLAVENQGSRSVSVLFNTAPIPLGFAAAADYGTGLGALDMVLADLNHDGKPDIVMIPNDGNNAVRVLLSSGDGTFQTRTIFAVGTNPQSVAVGDLNGDGIPDLVVANQGSDSISELLGTGDGTFQSQPDIPLTGGAGPTVVVAADLNGDGYPDLVVLNAGSHTVSVLLNNGVNGNGTFGTPHDYTYGVGSDTNGNTPTSLAVGDLNGDAMPDLVVSSFGGGAQSHPTLSMLLNQGVTNGSLAFQNLDYITPTNPQNVVVADLNGDGSPDLVVTSAGSNTLIVLLNQSTDATPRWNFTSYAFGNAFAGVAVTDLNGDGYPDVTVINGGTGSGANSVSVLLNKADGTFENHLDYAVSGNPQRLAVADLNGDGNPDLVVANHDAGTTLSVLLNISPFAARLSLSGSAQPVAAGQVFTFTLTAKTSAGGTASGYRRTVHFTSSDPQGSVPADYTFTALDAGVHQFKAALNTPGISSVTATDTGWGALVWGRFSSSGSFTVASHASPALSLHLSAAAVSAGSAVHASASLSGATSAAGAVSYTVYSDAGCSQDAQTAGTKGVSNSLVPDSDAISFNNAGTYYWRAGYSGDDFNSAAASACAAGQLTVSPGAPAGFSVSAPAPVTDDTAFSLTVTAEDDEGNITPSYTGKVHLTSSDTAATLPADYTFAGGDNGTHTFAGVILRTLGSQTITVTDTAPGGIADTSAGITVSAGAASVVTGLSVTAGPVAGGTQLTLSGTELANTTAVSFGGAAAAFQVVSDTQLTVTSPQVTAAGQVDVTVTADGQTSSIGVADRFTYLVVPGVTSISPAAGPTAGGTLVTITGSGFDTRPGGTTIKFGTTQAAIARKPVAGEQPTAEGASISVACASDTVCYAVSPAGGVAAVTVSVTTAGGSAPPGDADVFIYGPVGVLDLDPASGPPTSTTTIHGVGFAACMSVTFRFHPAGQPAPHEAEVVADGRSAVGAAGGCSNTTCSVKPSAVSCAVDGRCTALVTIPLTKPALPTTTVADVQVTVGSGSQVVSSPPNHPADQFAYQPPTLNAADSTPPGLAPAAGPPGTTLTLSGTGFATGGLTATFVFQSSVQHHAVPVAVKVAKCASATTCAVTVPALPADPDTKHPFPITAAAQLHLTVGGLDSNALPFSYAGPAVAKVDPNTGVGGAKGTKVTITGTGFVGKPSVSFVFHVAGKPALDKTVAAQAVKCISETECTAVAPLPPTPPKGQVYQASVDVQMTVGSGLAALRSELTAADQFNYTAGIAGPHDQADV